MNCIGSILRAEARTRSAESGRSVMVIAPIAEGFGIQVDIMKEGLRVATFEYLSMAGTVIHYSLPKEFTAARRFAPEIHFEVQEL